MIESDYAQLEARCRLEWGLRGATAAADRGDMVVIVDVLSFSTCAVTATSIGMQLIPCAWEEDALRLAKQHGAQVAVSRGEGARRPGGFSLSPLSFLNGAANAKVVLPSPNGATCVQSARHAPKVFCAALVNAIACANALNALLSATDHNVTVVACGERWCTRAEEGRLRFALEDYLGAGAIMAQLNCSLSPEASFCANAFIANRQDLENLLLNCGSGIELCFKGFEADVAHAAQLNIYDALPQYQNGLLVPFQS